MVGLSSLKKPKVALTIYVDQEVKRGLKMIASLEGKTTSQVIEEVCIELLDHYEGVKQALRDQK